MKSACFYHHNNLTCKIFCLT